MHFLKIAANVPKMTWDINVQNSLELNDKTMFSFLCSLRNCSIFHRSQNPIIAHPQ